MGLGQISAICVAGSPLDLRTSGLDAVKSTENVILGIIFQIWEGIWARKQGFSLINYINNFFF